MKKFARPMRATRPLLLPPKPPGWGLFHSAFGHDPYNSVDQHNMARRIIMHRLPLRGFFVRQTD